MIFFGFCLLCFLYLLFVSCFFFFNHPLPALSHLELLRVFLLRQLEAKLVGCTFQLADLLGGLSKRLLQLVEFLLFLLLQSLLYVLLLPEQKLPQTTELCSDQLLQISRSLLQTERGVRTWRRLRDVSTSGRSDHIVVCLMLFQWCVFILLSVWCLSLKPILTLSPTLTTDYRYDFTETHREENLHLIWVKHVGRCLVVWLQCTDSKTYW